MESLELEENDSLLSLLGLRRGIPATICFTWNLLGFCSEVGPLGPRFLFTPVSQVGEDSGKVRTEGMSASSLLDDDVDVAGAIEASSASDEHGLYTGEVQ